ncbi:hypothetical protein [Microbacterium testaceum]|uniref:hypothetical protein n=1 Tax=Microbacterium testaceum TaxID=2033 RepID=UPI0025B22CD5|nr:hypothetical protein [Microbacterium testaceum]WJS91018.1 hypothetical protein NYQ11_00275 [Microbacterium testaceum]
MRVVLNAVAKGRAHSALPETSTSYETGRATLVVAETEQRPTVLGLVASGRMKIDSGTVTLDGRSDSSGIRRRVALVDAPVVSEPESNVTVTGVVAEELMFAGHAPNPFSAARWLEGIGLESLANVAIGNVEPAARVRLLLELAALRKDVEGLVLVAPDRHGGEPLAWWRIAEEFAERGYAVLVVAGHASRTMIDALDETVEAAR